MLKIAQIIIMINLIFICTTCSQNAARIESTNVEETETQNISTKKSLEDCVTMKFRYIVTENTIQSSNFRKIEVFLDEREFTVENFKELFSYLSNKYPDPKYLTVLVKTNWEQLQFPSDCPGVGISNVPRRPDEYDYHQAIYFRRGKNEYFRYSTKLKTEELETIVIKGRAL